MKCYKCNKQIPSVSTVCPYCSAPVDPNYKPQVDFGDIAVTDYDEQNDLKAYIHEPEKKKRNLFVIIIVCLIVLLTLIFALVFNKPKKGPIDKVLNVINDVDNYITEKFFDSNNAYGASYKIDISVNGEKTEFIGNYERDVKSHIVKLSGVMRDPKESSGGVILDSKDFEFDAYLSDNDLYFKSEQLYNNYLYLKLDDTTGLLTTKNYNLDMLKSGIVDAIKTSLSKITLNEKDEKINYRGEEKNTNKYYFVFDNKTKVDFYTCYYNSLIDDANFINEYARIKGIKSDEVIEKFKAAITDAEFRYSGDSENNDILSFYFINKNLVKLSYEIEETKSIYELEIKDGKYYFDYSVDNKNIISSTLVINEETIAGEKSITYGITFDSDDYVMDITLVVKPKDKVIVKKSEINNYVEISNISEEDKNTIKNNLSYYTDNTEIVDAIITKFKDPCVKGLNCQCDEASQVCSCLVNGNLIKCSIDKVVDIPTQRE